MKLNLPFHDDLVSWRQDIHAHPELGFQEVRTSEFVADMLRSFGLDVTTGLAKTGVVATLRRKPNGRSIGLRSDMDALPIAEENTFAHRSRHEGVMHACGHDGHTAMLLGAARHMAEHFDAPGQVHFIFQPAEEGGGGAKVMVDEGLFDRFPCDAVFGMHNAPGLEVGKFSTRPGPFLAGVDKVEVTVTGKGTHGALPYEGIDPVLIAAQIAVATPGLIAKKYPAIDPIVFSLTTISAGTAINVIPNDASLKGTVRHFKLEYQKSIHQNFKRMCDGIASAYGATCHVNYTPMFPPLINSVRETNTALVAAATLVGKDNTSANHDLIMGSEDFACMLQARPGCYIAIGNGTDKGGCMVHNPNYDFNDDILSLGARYWADLSNQFLAQGNQPDLHTS